MTANMLSLTAMKCKIVIDTSVFISALIGPRGPSRELLRKCFEGDYSPLMSNTLFAEYEDVSKRPEIIEKTKISAKDVETLTHSLYSISEWIPIYFLWRPNLADEQDNHIIELAVAGNAPIIATKNIKDFKSAELNFPELSILKPEQVIRGI